MKFILYFLLLSISNTILQTSKVNKVFKYALEKIGCGYILGGKGQFLTEDKLKYIKHSIENFFSFYFKF